MLFPTGYKDTKGPNTKTLTVAAGTHLKALYTGRYQQTKEQGVKRSPHRMARPRPTPLLGSTKNMAMEEMRLKTIVQVETGDR